jgi:CHAT domain-containing protein
MEPRYLAFAYKQAIVLRYMQRQFVSAERFSRLAESTHIQLWPSGLHPNRIYLFGDRMKALVGVQDWQAAIAEMHRMDGLVGQDKFLQKDVNFNDLRGSVYLHTGDYTRAIAAFKNHTGYVLGKYGEGHYEVALYRGLHGVALWSEGSAANRAAALPLLQSAVRDLMLPRNAEIMDNIGTRKERREEVFAAYLEAMATQSLTTNDTSSALQALGPSDWIRGGLVQEALSDAALRSAAGTPALAELVRHEQDTRNEIRGLRSFLSGEAGGAASPLPAVAAQMRQRIDTLDVQRGELQTQIKAQFPDYDRLVRPTAPSTQDITARLQPGEALIVIQPTPTATYVWALTQDGPAAFHRADVTSQQITTWVQALRTSLDVAGLPAARRPPFAHSAAAALHAKLLAPLQSTLQGKTQYIVAAGGALGQIPFAVLQTDTSAQPGAPLDQAPWLIKQTAITHVPSVAAWLTMRTGDASKAARAPEALMAWGDPQFRQNVLLARVKTAQAAINTVAVRKINLTRANTQIDLETDNLKTEAALSALRYGDIPALPETRDELLAIAQALQANPAKDLLLGDKATRSSVLQANADGLLRKKRVIAFATHGLMAGDLPHLTQPALALAATGTDAQEPLSPLLTLSDVLTLKLNADWVVLSACNTAAADGKAEEALSGLARGFFYAGGRSLLVTHWAVESESAKQLTTQTFAHYTANPQAPKAESLRQAMLKVMGTLCARGRGGAMRWKMQICQKLR